MPDPRPLTVFLLHQRLNHRRTDRSLDRPPLRSPPDLRPSLAHQRGKSSGDQLSQHSTGDWIHHRGPQKRSPDHDNATP
jgi:hypothetical protein